MPVYKRAYERRIYFFTVITYKRRRFLCDETSRIMLRETINDVRAKHPFKIDAWVLLPDHIHCIWTLPYGDTDFSTRWGLIKAGFSRKMNKATDVASPAMSRSRIRQRESSYWQRRFWEHGIRDQRDYNAHMDYIHFNPVKHSLVNAPKDWKYSSFHRLVDEGVYDIEWGAVEKMEFEGIGRE